MDKKKGDKKGSKKKNVNKKNSQRKLNKKPNLPHGGNDLTSKLYNTMEKHKDVSYLSLQHFDFHLLLLLLYQLTNSTAKT
jgi:E1A/CREB-binding protein